jgi:predicted metal-dependent hydrolase
MCSPPRPTGVLHLPYLQGYPPEVLVQVREMIAAGRWAEMLARRHPEAHDVRTERALYDYVTELESSHMKSAPPLAKVAYAPKLHIMKNAIMRRKSAGASLSSFTRVASFSCS